MKFIEPNIMAHTNIECAVGTFEISDENKEWLESTCKMMLIFDRMASVDEQRKYCSIAGISYEQFLRIRTVDRFIDKITRQQ